MHKRSVIAAILCAVALLMPSAGAAGERAARAERFEGSALVRVGDGEYTIPIECDDAARPELGFSTEPNRITRERTGRSSMVNLRLRPWKDSGQVLVTLDRYAAWMPAPASARGVLSLTLDMSPASVVRDNAPVALTYEMWTDGDRPQGLAGVEFEARCGERRPEAPSYRRLPEANAP